MARFETEWRVELPMSEWQAQISAAGAIVNAHSDENFADLVFGRHGFGSVDRDGWIVRIRQTSKCSLEVKERIRDGYWKETSVDFEGAKDMKYILERIGLKPHLLLKRRRVVFLDSTYEISFDDIELLGLFVEVELRESPQKASSLSNLVQTLEGFERRPPYGDIVRQRCADDRIFRKAYEKFLGEFEF